MDWKHFVSWIPGIPIAIANGILRELLFRRFLPELAAHQLSAASFVVFFGLYVWLIMKWLRLPSGRQALRLGLTWLLLTVAFEFLFGHFVMGQSWQALFNDYNLLAGRVWVLVLLWIAAAPIFLYRMRRRPPLSGS